MENKLVYSQAHFIRPAARHILTIGKGIIKDNLTAIGELVKNSYDADATKVIISFEKLAPSLDKIKALEILDTLEKDTSSESLYDLLLGVNNEDDSLLLNYNFKKIWKDIKPRLKLILTDNGNGMSRETILGHWLVPSTDNKLKKQESKNGRKVQGRKGIGRYAASILGNDLLMETQDSETGISTVVVIDWNEFQNQKYEYLDEVPILIESFQPTILKSGTSLEITGSSEWSDEEFENLVQFLQRLFLLSTDEDDDIFHISLEFKNFQPVIGGQKVSEYNVDYSKDILGDIFHYRISGNVCLEGNKVIAYYKIKNTLEEDDNTLGEIEQLERKVIHEVNQIDYCGELNFDLKVFDQDDEGLNNLKSKFTILGNYKNNQIRKLLEKTEGISIYRNRFRIRPYGDNKSFDWLGLNHRRINAPTKKLGISQISGMIGIESEENSGLIEKATREGLKEDEKFESLKTIILSVIVELENARNRFRDKNGLRSRNVIDTEVLTEKIFDFTKVYKKVEDELKKAEVSLNVIKDVNRVIESIESNKKAQIAKVNEAFQRKEDEYKQAIATYQVQATLGKIINVVLHEGRNPLTTLREQSANIKSWTKSIKKIITLKLDKIDDDLNQKLDKVIDRSEIVREQSISLLSLFSKLAPISVTKRGVKKEIDFNKIVNNVFAIFETEMKSTGISHEFNLIASNKINGWEADFMSVFTNLIENSIYWLKYSENPTKHISVTIDKDDFHTYIRVKDNGLGIPAKDLLNDSIFEPGFSTKPNGTGLGLTIAGESIKRNGGKLEALQLDEGAEFVITI
ncbi:sensor histidine kinase [Flectobacillus major]|uniref:sensor histidine kinase n=1 Tax=Flectobacillus major TaxID=103 RepID=UPI0003FCF005|nr:sensor histidine kinase [Flectobacillus major]